MKHKVYYLSLGQIQFISHKDNALYYFIKSIMPFREFFMFLSAKNASAQLEFNI